MGTPKFLLNAGLTAHRWGEFLRGMCLGEVKRLLIPPHKSFGAWKDKAVYIDIEPAKADDKGWKEYTAVDKSEILTEFYAKVDAGKGGPVKIAGLLEKFGAEKFPKLCRQLYAKYKVHPVELWNSKKEMEKDL